RPRIAAWFFLGFYHNQKNTNTQGRLRGYNRGGGENKQPQENNKDKKNQPEKTFEDHHPRGGRRQTRAKEEKKNG
ncbi:hypothetical protein ACNIU7_29030, partial [Escherichia coli]